jgi:RNA polymerase sigma-70 factor (ECF subfamily)
VSAALAVSRQREGLEVELVTRFVAGDREAFRVIFERLSREIFLVVARYFAGAFDREEALQESWLQIYRARARFDVNRSAAFTSWAKQVARNRCLDLLKARKRTREVPVDSTEPMEPPSGRSQLDALHSDRVRAALESFAANLDAEQRAFFKLCFVEERSHEEIALALDISVRRSKYLKKKVLERLHKSATVKRVRGEDEP